MRDRTVAVLLYRSEQKKDVVDDKNVGGHTWGRRRKRMKTSLGNNRPVLRSLELLDLRMCQPCH